jgi:lactaldehyde dehydrogenase / glycolaldehyde dehydrogenase
MEQRVTMPQEQRQYTMFIDGDWTYGQSKGEIKVENPATEEMFATIPAGTAADAEAALEAAHRAQPAWAALPPIERARFLYKLCAAVERDREQLARIVVLEQGKPISQARGEIDAVVMFLSYAAENARRIEGDILPSDKTGEEVWIRRVPFGVVVGLTAWNYPAALAARKLGPALMAGNTIVLKAHECTPLSVLELARLAQEGGIPDGTINVVSGEGRTVGEALVRSKKSDLVTMTGSVRAGREIYAAGAEQLKVLRLELGGKAPFIVMEDADIDAAVDAAVISRFTNCGQICTCNERMYLHERIADRFLDAFVGRAKALSVGDPMTDPDMGPKVSRPEVDKVAAMVEEARSSGATILTGGHQLTEGAFARGHWFEPTVITANDNRSAIMQQEIFGPVVPVMRVASFDEALALANDSAYGLSAYVYTRDLKRLMRLSTELEFGELYVNRPCGELVQGFHTGWKQSGLGGEDGKYGFDQYLRKKTTYVNWA